MYKKSYSSLDSNRIPFDMKLENIFNYKNNGFFIELGAHDGLFQSNTAFFEFTHNWKGILIEPTPGYLECIKNRPNSKVYNKCCVSNDYTEKYIKGDFLTMGAMCSVNGERLKQTSLVDVEASTLENIIDDYFSKFNNNQAHKIDFLSLDTEGYELNVLRGLNLDKYRPEYMLIEIYKNDYENIITFLINNNYTLICNFSNYNNIQNPLWDGTHNDYLFKDNKQN